MSPLTQFNAPGYLTDFTPENAKRWSDEFVNPAMTRETKAQQVSQFYNEVTSNWTETPSRANISWVAFPNTVRHEHPADRDRWEVAEKDEPNPRQHQDEYCEWSVKRDESGKVVRIAFTAEGPEYWERLAAWQPETVLELYREHNPGFDIKMEDLFSGTGGTYNPTNKWNNSTTTGSIMHLVHRNNTLDAQFHLGGQSTVLRMDSAGRPIRDADRLLRCSRLGGPYRNSDPHIGISVNNLAHAKMLITLADPLGLYLHSFNGRGFRAPDGTDVTEFWKWTRGTPADAGLRREAHWVRAVFEVPKEKGYVIGDITTPTGEKIMYGGQLADHIQVRLTGQAIRAGLHDANLYTCLPPLSAALEVKGCGKKEQSEVEGEEEKEEKEGEEEALGDRATGLDDSEWRCY